MAKTFDFNALEQPTLEVTLKDDKHTKIRLTVPYEALFERFLAASKELDKLVKKPTGALIRACFELWADIFSCNADGITFTAESLRDEYGLKLEHLIIFQSVYFDFITDIQNAKN